MPDGPLQRTVGHQPVQFCYLEHINFASYDVQMFLLLGFSGWATNGIFMISCNILNNECGDSIKHSIISCADSERSCPSISMLIELWVSYYFASLFVLESQFHVSSCTTGKGKR